MTTLFISDLHLDDERPESTQMFEHFVDQEAKKADALYILGDLFEFWIGDDRETECSQRVAGVLYSLSSANVPVYFLHGNRDFLIRENYAAAAGMQLLPEEIVVELYGTPTLLMHGDTLCTDDVKYQQLRLQIRNPQWQEHFLSSPQEQRLALVGQAREQSLQHQMSVSMDIMDVNNAAVVEAFERHGVRELIHGHTHRPAMHDYTVRDNAARRTVLGDWYTQGSVLRVTPESMQLESIPA